MIAAPIDDRVVGLTRRVAEQSRADWVLMDDDLRRWVEMESPTYAREALDRLAGDMAATFERYGLRSALIDDPAGQYVHAHLDGPGNARVALLCHHDTVFPLGTTLEWTYESGASRVTGPGVCDMKGGIVVAAHVVRLLATDRPFRRLEIVSVPDEEERDGPPATLDRLDGFDAVLCLECGREDHSLVAERMGGRWIRLTAHGRAAHAGTEPDNGRNAAHALAAEAVRIAELHHLRPDVTVQVTSLRAGTGINSVPEQASLVVDLRGPENETLEAFTRQIGATREHLDVTFSVEMVASTPAMDRNPAARALSSTAQALGAAIGHSFGESSTGGTSDAAWTAGAGIPTIDGLGPVGGLDHTRNEYALVETFWQRCGVLAGLVGVIDGQLRNGVPDDPSTSHSVPT